MNEVKKIVATTKQKSRRIGKNGSPNGIEKEKRPKPKSLKKNCILNRIYKMEKGVQVRSFECV